MQPCSKPPPPRVEEITLDPDDLAEEVDARPLPSTSPVSFPSAWELESERKSSPPVLERRKQLTKVVASAVGVAWLICQFAVLETALRSVFFQP